MGSIIESTLELSRACATVLFEASALVTPGPSYVFIIDLSPQDPTAVFQLDVYNGEDATGIHKFKREGQFVPRHLCFSPPLYFRRGIYLAFTTNVGSCTVHFLPRKD